MFWQTPPALPLRPIGPEAGTVQIAGFDEAANTGGLSLFSNGEQVLLMIALNNTAVIPTPDSNYEALGAGLTENGRGVIAAFRPNVAAIGTWTASRLALWGLKVASGTPTWTREAVYASLPSGGNLIPIPGFAGTLPEGTGIFQGSLWANGSVTAANAAATGLTFRDGSSGPPGRCFADAIPLSSFTTTTKDTGAAVGAAISAIVRISATI